MADYNRAFVPPAKQSGSPNDNAGSMKTARSKFRKGQRTRRMWSTREEEILIASLVELVAQGWKSDNGFRAGYHMRIEESLRKEFPNTDLRGTPHVTSKISSWKKCYNSLCQILSRSGVGFNVNNDYKIDCSDEQWEQICKVDANAKLMRDKPWPLWELWKQIFGKDRATGGGAAGTGQAAREARDAISQNEQSSQDMQNDYHVIFDDFFPDDNNTAPQQTQTQDPLGGDNSNSSGLSGRTGSTQRTTGVKRKADAADANLMDFLGNLHAETNARLEMISTRIGYEFDLGKARQGVFDKLCQLPNLTIEQRFSLCNILGANSQWLEIFLGMPDDAKQLYVLWLIEETRRAA